MCILLNINSNILSNHYIQNYVINFFRAKASPSKQATVAFPGLNYDITRFASIVRVGNGYCGINIEKNAFRPGQESQPIYIYITAIYLKTGVPENPLPDGP